MSDTPVYESRTVTHRQDCPAFVRAVVEQGTSGRPVPVTDGQRPRTSTHAVIQFRHKTTGAVLASMSTASGTVLEADVGECSMFITPEIPELNSIKVLVSKVTGYLPTAEGWRQLYVPGPAPIYLTPTPRVLRSYNAGTLNNPT